jgi:hypothetical protein
MAMRIPPQSERWLGFDLQEVMAAVGEHPDLDWILRNADFNCDVTPVWPDGWHWVEQHADGPRGLPITWAEMKRLGEICDQIIDGTFTGYDHVGAPRLQLAVMDSSYWILWSSDDAVLERVRTAFHGVEEIDEPEPRRR